MISQHMSQTGPTDHTQCFITFLPPSSQCARSFATKSDHDACADVIVCDRKVVPCAQAALQFDLLGFKSRSSHNLASR
eukprot:8593752-Heterocapsa_arctica.AAC.1